MLFCLLSHYQIGEIASDPKIRLFEKKEYSGAHPKGQPLKSQRTMGTSVQVSGKKIPKNYLVFRPYFESLGM